METLPQLPEPQLWTCEICAGPIDFWDPALRSKDYGPDSTPLVALQPRLCPECVVDQAQPEKREAMVNQYYGMWLEREFLQIPADATLLGVELRGPEGPFHLLGVGVDWWPLSLPHFVLDWGIPGCAPKILVLRFFVSIGWMRGPAWWVYWSWTHPETEPTYKLVKGKTAPTPAEWDKLSMALRRLHSIADDARRPRGTKTYSEERFRERAAAERHEFEKVHGRPPYGTELAPILGISESTFKRYKRLGWLSEST